MGQHINRKNQFNEHFQYKLFIGVNSLDTQFSILGAINYKLTKSHPETISCLVHACSANLLSLM